MPVDHVGNYTKVDGRECKHRDGTRPPGRPTPLDAPLGTLLGPFVAIYPAQRHPGKHRREYQTAENRGHRDEAERRATRVANR